MSLSCLRCLCISGHVTLIFVFVCFIHPSCGVTLKHAGRDESVMSALSLNFRSCHAQFLFVCAIICSQQWQRQHKEANAANKQTRNQTCAPCALTSTERRGAECLSLTNFVCLFVLFDCGSFIDSLIGAWLDDWLIARLCNWLIDCVIARLICDLMTDWLRDWWLIDCVNKQNKQTKSTNKLN